MIPAFQTERPLSSGRVYHPLIGSWDLDPKRWAPYKASVVIDLGKKAGAFKDSKIKTGANNAIISCLTYGVPFGQDYHASGLDNFFGPRNDGQWEIDFGDENNSYTNGYILAPLMFGQDVGDEYRIDPGAFFSRAVRILDFPWPIFCYGPRTFRFRVRNLWDRTVLTINPNPPPERIPAPENWFPTWPLQIVLHGLQDMGEGRKEPRQ